MRYVIWLFCFSFHSVSPAVQRISGRNLRYRPIEELQNNREHALKLYQEIIEKYPGSEYARKAEERVSQLETKIKTSGGISCRFWSSITQKRKYQKLAEEVAKGVESAKLKAVLKSTDEVAKEDFLESDGVIAGSPVYFGVMAWELKNLRRVCRHKEKDGKQGRRCIRHRRNHTVEKRPPSCPYCSAC
jgi:hypothetical protein